ncbi:MAG: polysaccharide deacetylase family protein, partial [Vallitaleaceae bacterium]|nr:polysaccharide deacetylase family protein [Vallitaleaceae bacterium]
MKKRIMGFFLFVLLIISGCNKEKPLLVLPEPVTTSQVEVITQEEATTTPPTEAVTEPIIPEINYEEIQPYEIGHIMVVMYHGIEEGRPPYQRAEIDFIKDLQYMYDHNYRLISMSDYKNGTIDIPAGMTPILLTFDDGLNTTFALEEQDGQLVPKKGTAIALLKDFCAAHPDFGTAASLYINGDHESFQGAGTLVQRLQWLDEEGYEIGNHTFSHPNLSKISGDEVQEEIGKVDALIKSALPNATVDVLTYPFGIRPDEAYRDLVLEGSYEGLGYHYALGFREGPSGPMVSALHINFDPYNCPRV